MKTDALTIGGYEGTSNRDVREHDDRFGQPRSVISAEANPWNSTVLQLFSEVVHRASDSIALADTQQSLTYAELWNFADAFRARLVAEGMRPGDRVGVAAARSTATVAAIVGIVMAGGCYVPIEVKEFSGAMLGQIRDSSGIRYWVADEKTRQNTDPTLWAGCFLLAIEDVARPADVAPVAVPAVQLDGDSPLYVMFTSGSTGLPKGVVVPHRAVARLVTGQEFIEFDAAHTFLLHSPLSFDASTLEFWGSLLHGSRLVIAPGRSLGLDDYTQLILQQGVTTLWLTAAMFHLAAEHTPELFAPLRQLVFGGDVISPRHVERIRSLYPTLRMVNGYGPTENTTFTCCYVVPREYRAEGMLPIGRAIAYTTVHILDTDRNELSAGEPGELATGGAGVALGYLGRPEATAEKFLVDPFSDRPGGLLYLTGDRAVARLDGTIEFLGRIDRQVKIAGHRVELAAIENALSASPVVADTAVVVLTVPSGEKQLVACVALASPAQNAEATLRAWLQARLSRTSTPQHWLFLERLPINANGKLDRSALQTLCETRLIAANPEHSKPAAKPQQEAVVRRESGVDESTTMAYLQELWATLLGRTAVTADENFFDLGGTSLLLIEMHARLHGEFASTPSLVEMFAFPTSRSLAARLCAGQAVKVEAGAGEQRGQRQRAAMLARRPGMHPSKISPSSAAREGGTR
ncbi:MAG TPA: non-ribosomal peptide synthetase [Acidobacteriaceae bacterium]|nr:non-ribosomal peptide synthetase [Acidobacteriaceae bacterium]